MFKELKGVDEDIYGQGHGEGKEEVKFNLVEWTIALYGMYKSNFQLKSNSCVNNIIVRTKSFAKLQKKILIHVM